MNATDFLKSESATEFLTGKKEVPFVVKALDFLTGHFSAEPDVPEITRDESGKLIVNVPKTAEVPAFQDPIFAAGMGIGAGVTKVAPLIGKLATGAREALGWATGGLSDVPKLAKAGVEGLAKAASAKPLAKAAEQRQAAGVLESITPEAKITAEGAGEIAAKAAPKPTASAAEFLKQEPSLESLHPQVQGGPTGELPKYAEGSAINLERIDTTEDVRQFLNGMTKQLEDKIGKHKVSWDETRAQAEALGWDIPAIKKTWERKGSFSAAEIEATRQTNLNAISTLHESLKNLPADRAQWTPEVRAQLLDAMDMIKVTSQAASEAGRALNIHKKILANDPAFKDRSQFERVLKILSGKGVKRTDELIDGLRGIDFNNIAEVNKYIYNITKTPWEKLSDQAFELWVNGLLSNPLTHIVNTTSNATTLAYVGAEGYVAAGIEAARAALTGTKRELFFKEGAENIFSIGKGLNDGWSRFAMAMKKGDLASKLDVPVSALPENIAKYLPTRALIAEDAFFKGFIEHQELNRLAYRRARAEGLKGDDLTKKIAEILESPPPAMLEVAAAKGKYLTYQKELGAIGNLVLKSRDVVPGLKYFIPFVKTPANIAKFALERTPLNFPRLVSKAVKGELKGAQLSEELAKPLLGTMIGTTAYIMTTQGLLTGGYPEKKAGREAKQNVGWQPYSIKIGDSYISYGRLEPAASVLGLIADFNQLQKEMTKNEQYNVAAGIMGAISNNISNKTFMQGFSNLIEAVNDPGRYGKNIVQRQVASVVPAVSGGIARSSDDYMRDTRTILDAVQARIPGASKGLPAKLTIWGDPIKREGSKIARFISPAQVSEEKGSPVEKEIERLNLSLGYPSRKIGDKEMAAAAYWGMVEKSGKQAKNALNKIIESPIWGRYSDETKEKVIRSIVERTRSFYRARAKAEAEENK